AFANVAPEVPAGVTLGASTVFDGLAMRWIRDYDPNFLRDRSVVSSFAGAASVEDGELDGDPANVRAVKLDFTQFRPEANRCPPRSPPSMRSPSVSASPSPGRSGSAPPPPWTTPRR